MSLVHPLSHQRLTGSTPNEACSGVCGFASHCYSDSTHPSKPRSACLSLSEERQVARPSLRTASRAIDPWMVSAPLEVRFVSPTVVALLWAESLAKISSNHSLINILPVLLLLVGLRCGRSFAIAMTRGAIFDRACDCVAKIQKRSSADGWHDDHFPVYTQTFLPS